ncbi:MAG TPA: GNAT family N-acetyltransferase [Croceibacterium sp.]
MRGISGGAPLLVTERLELWVPTEADLWPMHAVVNDPRTSRFLPEQSAAGHFERFCRNAGSWLLYGYGSFTLRERASGELIGNAGVFRSFRGLGDDFDDAPEAGWILRSDRVGQGLGREAMTGALAWFEREHGARRIVCMIAPGNAPSLGLAAALGFAAMRDAQLPDGEPVRLFERRPELR